MILQSGEPGSVEEQATRTTVWPGPPGDHPPQLRYQTDVRIDAGDIVTFLERWQYLTGRVEEYSRARIQAGQLDAPPPGGMIAHEYSLETRERQLWVPSPRYEQELIAWGNRRRTGA